MPLVTLIGEKQAKKDEIFVYFGPNSNCKNCKIKTVCFNLKKGRSYKILEVRDKHHDCNVHERGVRVVEVDGLPLTMIVDIKLGKNDTVSLPKSKCVYKACENFSLCVPRALQSEKQYKISKVYETTVTCPFEKKLHKVELGE